MENPALRPDPVEIVALAALMHRVADGVLTIEHDNGNRTVVSYGPDGQMTPCELRPLVGPSATTRFAASIASLELGGRFAPIGGGASVRLVDGRREGWFVSTLRPLHVQTVLHACELPLDDTEPIDVDLVGDTVLDVTVGSVRLGDRVVDPLVDEITLRMRAACAAEEVVWAVRGVETPGEAV
ncbi:MAG: hypothetical protein AAGA99_07950 [Actinomycetota bacterium]